MKERFWGKADASGEGCWEWIGALNNWYGWFSVNGFPKHAHRVAALLSGKISSLDEELHVLHHCDNPKCCNPKHLFLGTNADNVADKVKKGRCGFKRQQGQCNGMAKLSDEHVKEIRHLYESSELSQSKLAQMYGVRQPHISRIVNQLRCGGVL
jgi:hypothetical protein